MILLRACLSRVWFVFLARLRLRMEWVGGWMDGRLLYSAEAAIMMVVVSDTTGIIAHSLDGMGQRLSSFACSCSYMHEIEIE